MTNTEIRGFGPAEVIEKIEDPANAGIFEYVGRLAIDYHHVADEKFIVQQPDIIKVFPYIRPDTGMVWFALDTIIKLDYPTEDMSQIDFKFRPYFGRNAYIGIKDRNGQEIGRLDNGHKPAIDEILKAYTDGIKTQDWVNGKLDQAFRGQ